MIQENNMWGKKMSKIESQIGGSQSTEAWNIVEITQAEKSLLNMETLKNHY